VKGIPISEFRAKCLAILRQVQKTKKPVRITRHGKPVADIVPVRVPRAANWMGSMKGQIKILGDIVSPAGEESDWEVLRD
jgi:prevent-host-death family protein